MLTRRNFLKTVLSFCVAHVCSPLLFHKPFNVEASVPSTLPTLSVVKGKSKRAMLENVLTPFGGLSAFIQKGTTVAIKPNAAWSRTPEQAANTDPELLIELIKMCYECGAQQVNIVEHTCDNPKSAFEVNGLNRVISQTKAKLVDLKTDEYFREVAVDKGKTLKNVEIASPLSEADVYINMPIAKTHGSATLTLGMKNHMGAIKNRWFFHVNDLHQCIADVSTVLTPDLIIVDAQRIMTTNGPKGPGDVTVLDTVIAGTDQVAVDSYAATLFGYRGEDIGHIAAAYEHGLGEIDLGKVNIIKKELIA